MDNVVTGRFAIEKASQDMGIVPGDPAYPFVQSMLRLIDEMHTVAADVKASVAAANPPVVFTNAQIKELSRELASSVDVWSGYLIKAFNGRSAMIGIAALLGAIIIGLAGGWLLFSPPYGLTCQDRTDGSQLCYVWTKPALKTAAAGSR